MEFKQRYENSPITNNKALKKEKTILIPPTLHQEIPPHTHKPNQLKQHKHIPNPNTYHKRNTDIRKYKHKNEEEKRQMGSNGHPQTSLMHVQHPLRFNG